VSEILGNKAGLLEERLGGFIERSKRTAQGRRHLSGHLLV
jgi:hypothetical protein